MAVVVSSSSSSRVTLSPSNSSSTAITVKKSTGGTLQSLSNVDSSSLEDGYTLIYDSETSKWVAAPISAGVAAVDGGSY
jgi:hypothetical protein